MASFPIFEHAKITSRDPNVRIQVAHAPGCAAHDGKPCTCDVRVRIVRPPARRERGR